MTPLALFWLLYILSLPFKKKKVETMEEFLDWISLVYPLIPPVYEKEREKDTRKAWV